MSFFAHGHCAISNVCTDVHVRTRVYLHTATLRKRLLARAARLAGTLKENWDKHPRDVLVAPLVVFKTEWVKPIAKIVMPAGTHLQGKALSRAVNALAAGTTKGGVGQMSLGQSAAHVLQAVALQTPSVCGHTQTFPWPQSQQALRVLTSPVAASLTAQ